MLRGIVFMFLTRTGLLPLVGKLMLDGRVPFRAKLIVPAAIVYLIWPFEIVPDIIPLAGWIDDILVMLIAMAIFIGSAPSNVVWEHIRGGKADSKGEGEAGDKGRVVEGKYRVIDKDQERHS